MNNCSVTLYTVHCLISDWIALSANEMEHFFCLSTLLQPHCFSAKDCLSLPCMLDRLQLFVTSSLLSALSNAQE